MALKKIEFRQAEITFSDEGRGRAVVLLHGFLGSHVLWKDLARSLARRYRVIAVDLPGHGATPCIGYAHSMTLMAQCVKAVMDSLRLKRYVLAGHSMGGYVALAFADLYPDNLRGLCLINSTAYADREERRADRLRAISLVRANRRLYTSRTIRSLFARRKGANKEAVKLASRIAGKTSRQGIVAALHGMRDRAGTSFILAMVTYPTLLIAGARDPVIPAGDIEEQASTLKNGALLLIAADAHFCFLESPETCSKAIMKFLGRCFRYSL